MDEKGMSWQTVNGVEHQRFFFFLTTPIWYLAKLKAGAAAPACWALKRFELFFPHIAMMRLEPPGCLLIQPVRLYTFLFTIVQQSVEVLCFLTCLTLICLTVLGFALMAVGAIKPRGMRSAMTIAMSFVFTGRDCQFFHKLSNALGQIRATTRFLLLQIQQAPHRSAD